MINGIMIASRAVKKIAGKYIDKKGPVKFDRPFLFSREAGRFYTFTSFTLVS